MTTITTATRQLVGVRFRKAGKIYTYDATGFELDLGEYVVVETPHGHDLAHVVVATGQMIGGDSEAGLRSVVRAATGEDREAKEAGARRAHEMLEVARLRSGERGTGLMLVAADLNLDGTALTLYYESENSVDYRSIVRDVGQEFGVDVVMERVGPRDRAKITGGYDRCGQELCCSTWLTTFPSVSIKMAKTQNLPLNPAKISGVCGRLYCCLTYEYEVYRELRDQLPKVNQRVETPTGEAKVVSVDPLKQTVTLQMLEERTRIEVPNDQLQYGKLVRPVDVDVDALAREDAARAPEGGRSAMIDVAAPPPSGKPDEQRADDGEKRRSRRRRRGRGGEGATAGPPQPPAPARARPPRPEPRGERRPSTDDRAPKEGDTSGAPPDGAKRRRRRRRGGGGGPPGPGGGD